MDAETPPFETGCSQQKLGLVDNIISRIAAVSGANLGRTLTTPVHPIKQSVHPRWIGWRSPAYFALPLFCLIPHL